MSKTDFLKTWAVIDHEDNPIDVLAEGTFNIYDDGDDKVVIQYNGFGAAYPSLQNGTYYTGDDKIVAMFSEDHSITFETPSSGTPTTIPITVEGPSSPSFAICCPELGEWGAEACPSG